MTSPRCNNNCPYVERAVLCVYKKITIRINPVMKVMRPIARIFHIPG